MNELQLQKRIVDVVKARRGFAMKMSHRFSVGVPDLLVKLVEVPAFVLEVKLYKCKRVPDGRTIPISSTAPQRRYLQNFNSAGMKGAVCSFVLVDDKKLSFIQFLPPWREDASFDARYRPLGPYAGPAAGATWDTYLAKYLLDFGTGAPTWLTT